MAQNVHWLAAGLSGLPVKIALITAAMTTGVNAFLVARRVPRFADASARTVVITMLAALPILFGSASKHISLRLSAQRFGKRLLP